MSDLTVQLKDAIKLARKAKLEELSEFLSGYLIKQEVIEKKEKKGKKNAVK